MVSVFRWPESKLAIKLMHNSESQSSGMVSDWTHHASIKQQHDIHVIVEHKYVITELNPDEAAK